MAHELVLVGRDNEAIHLACSKCKANARFGVKEGMDPFALVDNTTGEFSVEDADIDKWLGPCVD